MYTTLEGEHSQARFVQVKAAAFSVDLGRVNVDAQVKGILQPAGLPR